MGKSSPLARLCLGLITILALINLLAVFGPELGFDALWYHLTLPKLLLQQNRWFFPGGLLYYSAMPRLAETLFTPLLQLLGTTGPKLLVYFSGLITTYFVYQIARQFYDRDRSCLGSLLFYSTWLVGWQSGSAYVDLVRTMFETIALFFVLKNKNLLAGVALGLAIGTKWQALGSTLIFSAVFTPLLLPVALLTAAPWFYLAWHFTLNPIYPLFEPFMTATQLSQVPPGFFGVFSLMKRLFLLPLSLARPIDDQLNPLISPLFIYGVFGVVKKPDYRLKSVLLLAILGLIFWQLTPPPSARYLLPYLPAIILVSLSIFDFVPIKKTAASAIIASAIFLIFLRTHANSKYLSVVLGKVSVNQFLTAHADKLPSTFIDTDDWVAKNIPNTSWVLVENWHNLYYLPVNFDHSTWSDSNKKYDFLLTRDRDPKAVKGRLLHTNSIGAQIFEL